MSNEVKLEIRRPDKPPVVQNMEAGIYSIGSGADNTIVLPGDDVSERHAVVCLDPHNGWIEDLDSASGTQVDGHRISGHARLPLGQTIRIGKYVLVQRPVGETAAATPENAAQKPQASEPAAAANAPVATAPEPEPPPRTQGVHIPKVNAGPASQDLKRSIKKQIHEELVKRLNLKRLTVAKAGEEDLRKRARETIRAIISEVGDRLPPDIAPDMLSKEIYDEALGLGPLEELLADPEITEIMVNGHDNVYVEKKGKLVHTDLAFLDNASVLAIIERIVSPLGRRIDESQPYVDARLKDGSRVNAIIHPLSLVGPCLTIRKFSKTPFTDKDMIRFGTIVPFMAEFIKACVLARKNLVISGGTGCGKTTLLNVISNYLPSDERIVTIEDAAELRLGQNHVVSLEARPPNIEGRGAITIRDLVRNALRMRPDRIVVGECRGGEALDMLQAMNTGHDGSLTTVHANSPRDVISRLETMVLMSGMDLPIRAIREQVAAAVDVIIHESRMSDGTRKVINISEVVGLEGDKITMQDIFEFVQTGISENGTVIGHFVPTGSVPTFIEEFKQRGINIGRDMFDPAKWKQ